MVGEEGVEVGQRDLDRHRIEGRYDADAAVVARTQRRDRAAVDREGNTKPSL
jgi:hypothetical protein